jgi:serine/threonine-protein kinase RsbW
MLLQVEDVAVATTTWRSAACVRAISEIRSGVVEFAGEHGMAEDRRRDLGVAISEAVTNVVRHAYADDAPGEVRVDAAADDACLSVRVTDEGSGEAESDSLGLGLRLMEAIADRMELGPALSGCGTVVCMEFSL